MIYLTKEFETTYGTTANHHMLVVKKGDLGENGDYIFTKIEMHAYTDLASCEADARPVDCFQSSLTYVVSLAERNAEADEDDYIRAKKALLKKITASVLVDGAETNVFRGNAGKINYIGCV